MFATIDGTIAAWNPKVGLASGQAAPSTHAVTEVKMTDGSAYTGLTIGSINGEGNFLFRNGYSGSPVLA